MKSLSRPRVFSGTHVALAAKLFRNSPRHRMGAAAVELALILPIFVALLMGIIEFSRALSVSQLLTMTTRDHCRKAIISGTTTAAVIEQARNSIRQTIGPAGESYEVTITVDRPEAQNLVERARPGDIVTIKASIPFSQVQYLPGDFLSKVTLKSHCAMSHE